MNADIQIWFSNILVIANTDIRMKFLLQMYEMSYPAAEITRNSQKIAGNAKGVKSFQLNIFQMTDRIFRQWITIH